jgi:putative tryptophan/tyrosine transport system substrate-binding protein
MTRVSVATLVVSLALLGELLAVEAQQPNRVRQIGVLMSFAESDSEARAYVAAFREGLQKLGWTEGRNIRIHFRWAALAREARA